MKKRTSQFDTTFACLLAISCIFLVAKAQPRRFAWQTRSNGAQEQQAWQILDATGVEGGLVVHVGCGDGKLTAALRANERYLVHGLDADPNNIEQARGHIRSLGLYGKVSVEHWTGNTLPYIDNLANLVVSEGLGGISMDEVMRVLCPNGVAYIKNGQTWNTTVKPWPDNIDQWTHYLHGPDNNAVANDDVVAPPKGLQWVNSPLWSRAHSTLAGTTGMVSAKGRVFTIEDRAPIQLPYMPGKYTLVARDGFNGIELWSQPLENWEAISHWMKATPVQLTRRLVAIDETVYATLGIFAPVTALDAKTGNILQTYQGTELTQEIIVYDKTLYLVVGERMKPYGNKPAYYRNYYDFGKENYSPERISEDNYPSLIMAVDARTGETLWQVPQTLSQTYRATTLAVNEQKVFFQAINDLVCLDRQSGSVIWKKTYPVILETYKSIAGTSPTLVLAQDKLFRADGEKITAYSQNNGKELWRIPIDHRVLHHSPPDVFIAQDALWQHYDLNGYDLNTGKKIKVRGQTLNGPMGHDRCYRNKATKNYIINSKTGGSDFSFLGENDSLSHAWVRGTCETGILPCNGLLYASPHACSCVNATKLYGFYALNAQSYYTPKSPNTNPLETGPAYGMTPNSSEISSQWPTYRQDITRSATADTVLTTTLTRLWCTKISDTTAPIIAQDKVFVADQDAHTVYALHADTGEIQWDFTAAGRIDSPPTYTEGRLVFGCHDGWVYCLEAQTGLLCWRFRAAPNNRLTMAFGQPASLWPVHGSVLVLDGLAYVVAGRSSFLNGGLFLFALDLATGQKRHEARIEGPVDESGEAIMDTVLSRNIQGNKADILVSDGNYIYLRHMAFHKDLSPLEKINDGRAHIITVSGFLDNSSHHRSNWTVNKIFLYDISVNKETRIDSDLLAVDGKKVYGIRGHASGRSPVKFNPKDLGGFYCFAKQETTKKVSSLTNKMVKENNGQESEPAWEYQYRTLWEDHLPINGKAMLKSGDSLYIAGYPNEYPDDDLYKAIEGRMGGLLAIVSAGNGRLISTYNLDGLPRWDGMAAANGRLYLSMKNGKVQCLVGTSYPPRVDAEDFETGDFSRFPWEHYGDATWAVTSWEKYSGTYSAEAGSIDHDESTTLRVTLDCISGNITFYRKVSSESRCDYLKFYIDGVRKGRWSGEEDWAQVSFDVTAGTRTFEWTYSKDGSESEGYDTAWIDDIVFPIR